MGRLLVFRYDFRRFLAALLFLGTATVQAQLPSRPVTADQYTGMWDRRDSRSVRSVVRLDADGTWADSDEAGGKWAVEGTQLVVRYSEHPDWLDRYLLPGKEGVLHGKDAGGNIETITRRSAVVTKPLAGGWEFFNLDDGKRVHVVLSDNGMWSEYEKPAGYWQVDGDLLVLNFKALGWVDAYSLPLKGDVLYGQNRGGAHLTLSRNGATPGEFPVKPLPEGLTGNWNFSNANDGHHSLRVLSKDGKFSINGKPSGTWRTVADQLVLTYEPGNGKDTYNLPPDNGMVSGTNPAGHKLSLARSGTSVPKELNELRVVPSTATTALTTPRPGPTVHTTVTHDVTFFGKRGAEPANDAAPGGAPAPTATDAASAATPAATPTLTPVGKWQWHSNITYTLTENGAVKAGQNVAGQWKWIDKAQGEIQVQWSLVPVRPAENYTLSAHGNHLTWKNAPQGQVRTEDRVD